MAHIEKYKAEAVGHMLAHYRRDECSFGRENIDVSKTGENVTLRAVPTEGKPLVERWPDGLELPNWHAVRSRIEACDAEAERLGMRRTRKDAVVLADVVVTMPEDVRPGDELAFFEGVFEFFAVSFGADNVLGGFVHLDEVRKDGTSVRPHIHVPFTPVLDGRFNFKRMVPRAFYQGMHKALGDYLEPRLGYRPALELDEEARAQRVYADRSTDIDRVRGAVERAVIEPARAEAERMCAQAEAKRGELEALGTQVEQVSERLECLRRQEAELESTQEGVSESAGALWKARRDGERERVLGEQIEGLRKRISGLERRIGEQRARLGQIAGLVEKARGLVSRLLSDGVRALTARTGQAVSWLRWYAPTTVGESRREESGLKDRFAGSQPALGYDDAADLGRGRGL